MDILPVSFSWLSILALTQSILKEIWFNINKYQQYFSHHTPPFLSSFIEESRKQSLRRFFDIPQVGLHRTIGQSGEAECTSLIEVLTVAASSFPKLQVLTLDLDAHKEIYNIGDLAPVLARFSSLRVAYLDYIFSRLEFGFGKDNKEAMPLVRRERSARAAESGLILFASCLARQIRTLDSIHINNKGYEHDELGSRKCWNLRGWLHVLNSNRDVSGTLRVH
ncbi:hypothetical protein EV360DRAFT_71885 [Lentinula raphanica]|nr:hypothetical protein EV360DRAFT_71885 [Lentinula raphanica]